MKKISRILCFVSLLSILLLSSCTKEEPSERPTPPTRSEFTDPRDNSVYQLKEINGLIWMTENLRYKGNDLGWVYNNDATLEAKYGRLYNWEMAQQACPTGWRLPEKEELEYLADAVADEAELSDLLVAGGLRQNELSPNQYPGLTEFQNIDLEGLFWSGTENPEAGTNGIRNTSFFLFYNQGTKESSVATINKEYGISIRCVEE